MSAFDHPTPDERQANGVVITHDRGHWGGTCHVVDANVTDGSHPRARSHHVDDACRTWTRPRHPARR